VNEKQNSAAIPIAEQVTLSRDLSLFTITMIGVGGMIGAGIFVLTGIAAGIAGPTLVLMFLLNGLITVLSAMSYAELGSAFPEADGGYLWVKEDMGGAQVIGATNEPLFKNLLVGNIPEQVAQQAAVTVVMVKQRSSPLHSFLRQTVLEPTTKGDQEKPSPSRQHAR
jgi:Amino acid permease